MGPAEGRHHKVTSTVPHCLQEVRGGRGGRSRAIRRERNGGPLLVHEGRCRVRRENPQIKLMVFLKFHDPEKDILVVCYKAILSGPVNS